MHPAAAAARERVLAAHRGTVEAVVDCADEAAADLDEPADRDAVVAALEPALWAADVPDALVALLSDAVEAAGYDLLAEPVAAPPYVVVTGRGPLARATVADGRLVVLLRAFALDRESGSFVHADVTPDEAVEVRFRRTP